MPVIALSLGQSRCEIQTQGAQLSSWVTDDGREQIYLSPRTAMDGQSAIRGGVPLCFPQFNMRVLGLQPLPKHGFVRNRQWQLAEQAANVAHFDLHSDADTRAIWPHDFSARMTIRLAEQSLLLSFEVHNKGWHAFPFALALHTYLAVDDIEQAQLHGLQDAPYWDAVADAQRPDMRQRDTQALRFGMQTDRVYAQAPRTLVLREGARALQITHSASLPDTVVWNPGAQLCAQLPDMPPQGWRRMLCVEAARINEPVILEPGQRFTGWQALEQVPADFKISPPPSP